MNDLKEDNQSPGRDFSISPVISKAPEAHLLYGPGYVTIHVRNLTEDNSYISIFKFPTGV
jgi:hypothetical protein